MPTRWHAISAFLALPTFITGLTLDCTHIREDGQSWDLRELGGPHAVHHVEFTPPSIANTTFTVDICNKLPRLREVVKDDQCEDGTRVCGITSNYNDVDNSTTITRVAPIAGEYSTTHGRKLEPQLLRLKNEDRELEGLRVELHGGRYPFKERKGTEQMAVVDFICDHDLTGNEGFPDVEKSSMQLRRRADEDGDTDEGEEPEFPDPDVGKSLQFKSYNYEGDGSAQMQVLRLEWRTKYACEGETSHAPSAGSGDRKSGWGFFTWFIIILFLLVAAYLIFGSWMNYSRYGARGWDLVPHGDTIRDLPYLVKDWSNSVVSSVKGGGNRGGYSAV